VRTARAEAYMILRKYDEANGGVQTIIKDFPHGQAQEARYRLAMRNRQGRLTKPSAM